MYASAQAGQQAGTGTPPPGAGTPPPGNGGATGDAGKKGGDDVVDADFTMK